VLIAFGGGIGNKPVAEDFIQPREFLVLGDDRQFRPLFAVPLLLIRLIFGPIATAPEPYHVLSLLVHLVSIGMLFLLVRQLTHSAALSLAAAALFAVFPRQHGSVLWPAGLSQPIMGSLLLLAVLLYVKGRQDGNAKLCGAAVIVYCLSIFANEAGAAGLALFGLYELCWQMQFTRAAFLGALKRSCLYVLPFVLPVLIYGSILVLGSSGLSRFVGARSDTSFYHLSLSTDQIRDLAGYISYTLVPFIPLRTDDLAIKVVLLTISLVAIAAALLLGSRLTRFAAGWIVVTVLPYVLLVPYGNAERYFYVPSMGFALLAVGAFQQVRSKLEFGCTSRWPASPRIVRMLGLLVLASYLTVSVVMLRERTSEWKASGDAIAGLLDQVYADNPAVTSDSSFYFVGLPDHRDQAYFLALGTRAALRDHYNATWLQVNASHDPELVQQITDCESCHQSNGSNHVRVYLYDQGRLIDRSGAMLDDSLRLLLTSRATEP
jgi:hypothetical protein